MSLSHHTDMPATAKRASANGGSAPDIEIGATEKHIPIPMRGSYPALDRVLAQMEPGDSVPITGAPVDLIRSRVSVFRRAQNMPKHSFSVCQMEDHVRVWRR